MGVKNIIQKLSSDWKVSALVVSVLFTVIFAIATLYLYLVSNHPAKITEIIASSTNSIGKTSISGTFNLNGVAPDGSTIAIAERKVGDSQFNIVLSGLAPTDGGVWSWNAAKPGIAYEVQAYLQQNGNTISQSNAKVVAAPADSEVLTINSKAQSSAPVKSVISGSLDLNGYIPPGSLFSIQIRKNGTSEFTVVASGLQAIDSASWSWSDALSGTSYDMQANMIYNGNVVAQSKILTVTAPAYNESLRINSSLPSPVSGFQSISGIINHNGLIPANSSYSIAQRKSGSSQFTTVITGIPIADSAAWNWSQAQSGINYDLQAYLVTNGNITAQSQILTVAAPAVNEVFTINAQNQPPAPPGSTLSSDCVGKGPNGLWQVRISYNINTVINNAQQYWLTIGNSSQDSSFVNSQIAPSSPQQSQSYTTNYVFNEGTNYYAQWAYSTCKGCNVYSSFSPSLQFYCNTQPPTSTPTSSPTPSNTPTGTSTPVPTSTLTPTYTTTPTPSCVVQGGICLQSSDCCDSSSACIATPPETVLRCAPSN